MKNWDLNTEERMGVTNFQKKFLNKNNNKKYFQKRWHFSILSTKEFLSKTKTILSSVIQSHMTLFKEKRVLGNIWVLSVGGGYTREPGKIRPRKLYNFLYANISIALRRKKRKFERIIYGRKLA